MKKSFLPYAMALMLVPQFMISQDSMDVTNDLPQEVEKEVVLDSEKEIKSAPSISTLQSFELIKGDKSGVKVAASFIQKVAFELIIYNNKGIQIYSEAFETDDLNLAMGFSNLPKGEYFIKLKTKDGEAVRPIE